MKYSEHKSILENKYGTSGLKKADKLYALAYEFGHSNGYDEVENFYSEILELIKDNIIL